MVMNDVVLQTVKRMVSSGVDDNTIKMTLQGINLSDEKIQEIINEARGIKPAEPPAQQSPSWSSGVENEPPAVGVENHGEEEDTPVDSDESGDESVEGVEESDEEDEGRVEEDDENNDSDDYSGSGVSHEPSVRQEAEAISQEQAAQHATTHQYMEEHGQKIDDVKKNMDELHKKIDAPSRLPPETTAKIDALDRRMSSLEKEIGETKANTIAIQELLKKILETNKKTLLKLK